MGRHSADAPEPPSGHESEGHPADFDDYQTSSPRRIATPPPPGHRRRAALAIGIALLGVVLLVFGVITLTQTDDPATTSSQGSATQATASTAQTPSPTVPSSEPVTSSAPQSPEMLPVTVLNNSPGLTPGLATNVADALEAGGWPIAELLNYSETQVSATTAFFTPGNAAEESAAQALVAQFPEISGGAQPRFEGLAGAGLTVAAVGDWVP